MRSCTPFHENWFFQKCPAALPDPAAWAGGAAVTLPHTWYADGDYYRGDALYQKKFTLPLKAGQHAFLRFHGVDKVCHVYLNGRKIGAHAGAYTVFAVELTGALQPGENLLSVAVNNETGETVSPLSGDFTCFGGIHRKVELIVTGEAHFPLLYWGAPGVELRAQMQGETGVLLAAVPASESEPLPAGLTVRYTVADNAGQAVAAADAAPGETARLELPAAHRWDGLRDPYLYTVTAELCRGGDVLDAVALRTGFRTVRLDAEKGFFLNGEHLKLRGVAKHQDTAGVFSAAGEEHWRQDIDLICEVGANAVRLSHYPHPQPVYDLCDERGLVVWAEIPVLKLTPDDALLQNAQNQLREMIYQNLHHPSVCFWGVQNEIAIFGDKPYMAGRVQRLNELAHALDPDRLTVSANLNSVAPDSALNRITDATTYNLYFGWYYGKTGDLGPFLDEFHRQNPAMPLGVSEYGADANPAFHSDAPQVNDYSEEFQALYHETVYPVMAARDFVWGTFVWNMFDFVSAIRNAGGVRARNIKGLVTFDRATCKDAFYYYKAIWSAEPFVHIAARRYRNRAAEAIDVKVYTNQKTVSLTAAGITRTAPVQNGSAVFTGLPLAMGDNCLTARAGTCTDEVVFTRAEQPDPSYVFVDENPGLNVRNWFLDEAEEARLFPADAYSVRDKLSALLACPEVLPLVETMQPKIAKLMREAPDTFTLEQVIKHEKPDVPDEEIKQLNIALTRIPKPGAQA